MRPLVFLHGAAGLQPGDPLVAGLAARYELFTPLTPGLVEPADLDAIRDIHELAFHYDELLEAHGLDGVAVVGHSFGAMVGAELAAHVPSRVAKLVLLAPLGLWNDCYPPADLFAIPPAEMNAHLWGDPASPPAKAAGAVLESVDGFAGGDLEASIDLVVGMAQAMAAAAKFIWPIPDKGLARRLHRIRASSLVVWGDSDRVASARYCDDFVAGIPQARGEVLEGAGHMLPFERPAELLALIGDFVAK